MAGLAAADGTAVRMLTNGLNGYDYGGSFRAPHNGVYFRLDPYNSEFADSHFPNDPAGNMYKGVWGADLAYRGENKNSYRDDYAKQTNAAEDDWSDLIELTRVLTQTPDAQYYDEVSRVVDIDQWLRYFAVNMLIGNRENSMGGVGNRNEYISDDYSLYIGILDPKAHLLVHDLDTVLGQGDDTASPTYAPGGLFPTGGLPILDRFLKEPQIAHRLYEIYLEEIATTFAPENLNPLLDQVLGGWLPPATIQSMKDYAAARRAHILSLIPSDLTAATGLGQSQGYDYTTTNHVDLTGTADAAHTATVLVGTLPTDYTPWTGTWTTVGSTSYASAMLVSSDGGATFHVPTVGEDPQDWTAIGYNDDAWVSQIAEGQAGLLVTEIGTGDTRYVEIENVSDAAIATAGWTVLVNDPSLADIDDVFATPWSLPASVGAGQVLYQTDDVGDHYWGATIPWGPEGEGWVMVLDDAGTVMDFAAWGYTTGQIAAMSVDYGAFTGITVAGQWTGDGADPGTTGSGGMATTFVAYNDHIGGAGTHANATTYAADGTTSGILKDIETGTLTLVTLTTSQTGVAFADLSGWPAPGTDAYNAFNGYVDFSSATHASIEVAGADRYTHTFTGLDRGPNATYTFTGTAIRGDIDYTTRWTLVSLEGADAATPAYSTGDGVVYISNSQVAIWAGTNNQAGQGFVAAWTGIDPGTDGRFSVVSTQYTGAIPTSVDVGGMANGSKGYGLSATRLEEIGLGGPLSVLERTGDHDLDGAGDFVRTDTGSLGAQNADLTVPFGTITPVAQGLGFSGGAYDAYIGTDVAAAMQGTHASLWTRLEFTAPDLTDYDALTLNLRYDDGFVVYLNGAKVAEANAPASPAWDSAATGAHDGTTAVAIDLTPWLDDLLAGTNVLAIHGLNVDAADADFLVQAELVATRGTPGEGLAIRPGINRSVVRALDADGNEIGRTTRDVWYNDGSVVDVPSSLPAGTTTWTAADGPYRVTGNLTIPSGATLVIKPGTTVFFDSGTYMTVGGTLDARGTPNGHIRLTVTPGGTNWGGLRFSGGAQVSEIAYADIDYTSGSDAIDASGTAVHMDHLTFDHAGGGYYLDWHDASIILTNSVLPFIASHELFHFLGFPASGYALVQGNYFGGTSGYNDVIDFTGGQRPGPIAQFIGNVFDGGGDDCLDLDAADAYVAGNVFMHIHQDGDRESKSYAVTTGTEGGDITELTVVGNLFWDVDHAMLAKDGGFITAVNNTIVDVHKDPAVSGATTAVIGFYENRSGQWPGAGAILEGNVIYDVSRLWGDIDGMGTTTYVVANNNVIYDVDLVGETIPGVGNILEAPRLWNTTNIADVWNDFRLRPGSPAIGAGPNGVDAGALPGYLATIAGEPYGTTWSDTATLTVGGPDIYGYKYRLMRDGAWVGDWSDETPVDWSVTKLPVSSLTSAGGVATATVAGHGYANGDIIVIEGVSTSQRGYMGPFTIFNVTANTFQYTLGEGVSSPASGTIVAWKPLPAPAVPPIALSGLAAGEYTVYVATKNSAGFWQDEADATASRSWTVDPGWSQLHLSEIMASNATALLAGGVYPDAVELYYDAAPGSPALDLGGYSLTDNVDLPRKFTFAPGTTIAAGGYLTVYADTNPGAEPGIWLGFNLKAEGDDLRLFDPIQTETALDSVVFGIQLTDRSIGRRPDGTWGLATPTFGAVNQPLRMGDPVTLKINEWLTDGEVSFVNDFIELYNPDPLPVDMGGLWLSERPGAQPDMYQIRSLSFIEGSGLSVFAADDDSGQGVDHTNFKLSPYQGLIGLYDENLAEVDQVYYTPQATDVSQGRTPDGGDHYAFFRLPLPDVANPGITTIVDETVTSVLDFDSVWYYNQTQNLDGIPWQEQVYANETTWPTGAGLLFVENNVPAELRGQPLALGRLTYYFRTHFTYNGSLDGNTHLLLSFYVDDGAVLYLNGYRFLNPHMTTGVVTYSTLASSHEFALETVDILLSDLPPGTLHAGDNVLAVEAHQVNSGSTDVVWGADLDIAQRSTTVIVTDPVPENIYNVLDHLRMTEIMYDPIGGTDYEFIEFQNTGASTLDLAGVRITSGIDFTFAPTELTLGPGEYLVLARDATRFQERYGTGPRLAQGVYTGKLDNDGEEIILRLPAPYDAAVLRFAYDNDWYAPETAGDGLSLVLLDAGARRRTWGVKPSWRPSAVTNGSPGVADPEPEYAAGAMVDNEVLAHQDLPSGDWIELTNAYDEPIDLAGWYLSDDSAALGKFEITASAMGGDTVLLPGEYVVFTETDHFGELATDPGRHTAFALSEHGDDVWLSSATGGYLATAVFGSSANGVTLGRYQTSTGRVDFVALTESTRGYVNAAPQVGPVVISEIMYHPSDDANEFIELYNLSGSDVPLYDLANPTHTWMFTGGIEYAFPTGVTLGAGQYLLVTESDPSAFRATFGIDPSIPIYGPFEALSELSNDGEQVELSKPGVPDPGTGFYSYIVADAVDYSDGDSPGDPWPMAPDGTGPSLERVLLGAYGNDVINWIASPAVGGTPGTDNSTAPPRVTSVVLNPNPLRTVRTVSQIEPSGIGVDTVRVTFSETVTFTAANVVAEKVFVDESGHVSVTETLSPVVSGSGTTEMTIQFANAWQDVIDTWVRIRLTGGVVDGDGHALDGEPRLDSSNLGYIYAAAADLPARYATTPAIDCTAYNNIVLSFYRWLGVESASWDHAAIQVSNNGSTWTTVWDHTGSSFSETSWSLQEYDISAVADDQPTVTLRWSMGPTDSSVTYPGWNLDDVTLKGTPTAPPTRVRGTKFYDADRDGARDPGEPGLAGWKIYADANGDGQWQSGEPFAVTGPDGSYSITVMPGTHVVAEVLQDGWEQTVPGGGIISGTYVVTVWARQTVADIDFGNFAPATIRGGKWYDADQGGTWDAAEPGLPDWTVYLDLNGNGLLDGGNQTVSSTDVPKSILDYTTTTSTLLVSGAGGLTDVNVTLNIMHTWDSDLDVYLTSPSGTVVELFTDVGSSGDNFVNTTFDDEAATSIVAGTAPFTGSYRPEGLLAGFDGEDPNGTWTLSVTDDAGGDQGTLNSWSIAIETGEPSRQTGPDGRYVFADLAPGTYQVREVPQAGWTQTYPLPGGGHTVVADVGVVAANVDFGNYAAGEIRGTKWFDADQDGQRDPGEPGLAGWTIYADLDRDGQWDDGEPFDLTDPAGDYALPGLMPGAYAIGEVPRDGWEQTYPVATGYMEDFNDGLAQDWLATVPANWSVVAGEYRAAAGTTGVLMQSFYTGQTWQDGTAEVVMRRTGYEGRAAVLVVRASDDFVWQDPLTGSAYMVGISNDGQYYVARILSGTLTWLQEWATSPYLNIGATPNTVQVAVQGSAIEVRFNGNLAWSGSDTDIPGAGRVGLLAYSGADSETVHYFDDVTVTSGAGGGVTAGFHAVTLGPSQVVEDVDFGNYGQIPPPTALDLLIGSDTGYDPFDDITRLDNSDPSKTLQFGVGDTVAGATVVLWDDSAGVAISVPVIATGPITFITTNGAYDLVDGAHPIVATQALGGLPPAPSEALLVQVDTVAPRVAAFGVSSTQTSWVLGTVDSSLWTTDRSARTAPWSRMNRFVVDFDEPVISVSGDLTVVGAISGPVSLSGPAGVGTDRLTWTSAAFLARDRYQVRLAGGAFTVADLAGNLLDGESGTDPFPSGDGVAGGDWLFSLNVLVADVSLGDGVVNVLDKAKVRLAYGAVLGDANYDPLVDINGDGVINVIDKAQVRLHYGDTLPLISVAPRTKGPVKFAAARWGKASSATDRAAALLTDLDSLPPDLLQMPAKFRI